MREVTYGPTIRIHRCENCRGLFCTPILLGAVLDAWMVDEILDCGGRRIGRRFDRIEDIDCPRCRVPMDETYDQQQTHIWLESCAQCGGIFLDAREFTDLKYITVLDFFRDLLKGKRPVATAESHVFRA